MLDQGATSVWETIDGGFAFEKAGSLCHGWSAVPIYIYLRYGADLKKEGTALLPAITGLGSISVQKKTAPGEYILGL